MAGRPRPAVAGRSSRRRPRPRRLSTRSSTARPPKPRPRPSWSALRIKGETVEEMAGFVRSMFDHAVPLAIEGDAARPRRDRWRPPRQHQRVDHGRIHRRRGRRPGLQARQPSRLVLGRARPTCSRRSGSSSISARPAWPAASTRSGMGFCFAPRFHPALRHAGPVRRELGVPTVFNFLGPLANPARARHQLVGVSDPAMADDDGRRARGERQPPGDGGVRRRRARRAERDLAVDGVRTDR